MSDTAWVAKEYGVKQGTVSAFTRGDCTVSEFFTDEAAAWDAVAEINRIEAEHKQLVADEAVKRMEKALASAASIRKAAKP